MDEDPSTFICGALLPAKVMAVDVREEEKICTSNSSRRSIIFSYRKIWTKCKISS